VTPVELSPTADTRASSLTASQEQRVVDDYYDSSIHSPQALAITHTLGAESQDTQEVTEAYTPASVCFTLATASPGVPAQSVIVKPSTTPMSLDTPVKTSPAVMPTTARSSSAVTDTLTVAPQPKVTHAADTTIPVSTAASIPVSTAAANEIPTAAVSIAPIVIVRQLRGPSVRWKHIVEIFP